MIVAILIGLIAALHLYFFYLEAVVWETRGPKVFRGFPKELFPKTKAMAANQGLYNGFLAAGLIWSLVIQDAEWSHHVAVFFLVCVLLAGIFGALTVNRRIFFVQGLPALVALLLLLISS